jgi:predicted O-methyltransferase YrrM
MVERRFYQGKEYTVQVPYGRRVYSPWFDENGGSEFSQIMKEVQNSGGLVQTADRAYILHQFMLAAARLKGDMAECGVYQGGSAQLMAATLHRCGAKDTQLHLFDTFCGVPDIAEGNRDGVVPGDCGQTSVESVKARLASYEQFVHLHPGFIPDTFTRVEHVSQFSLVNIDVDLYPTTLACCEWFWPRMSPGGIMIFNDYGFFPYRHSTRRAADEFFSGQREKLIVLPSGQGLAIKERNEQRA